MDKPISVGDLVMVVRWPHRHIQGRLSGRSAPKVFQVKEVSSDGCHCPTCLEEFSAPSVVYGDGYALPMAWVKRIDPQEHPETVKREEEITA